jgi:hypothetical protein
MTPLLAVEKSASFPQYVDNTAFPTRQFDEYRIKSRPKSHSSEWILSSESQFARSVAMAAALLEEEPQARCHEKQGERREH